MTARHPEVRAIAGLAAITPASGSVGPVGAIAIGFSSSVLAYIFATIIKFKFRYDDALDVVGVHGVGGFVGIILVSVFAAAEFGGAEVDFNITKQLGVQFYAAVFAIVYTAVISFIILKFVDLLVGLRISDEEEIQGLDVTDHGESGYDL